MNKFHEPKLVALAPPTMFLAQAYLPCVKGYEQVPRTPNGSISSPYICAKSLDLSLYICMNWKCGRAMSTK